MNKKALNNEMDYWNGWCTTFQYWTPAQHINVNLYIGSANYPWSYLNMIENKYE